MVISTSISNSIKSKPKVAKSVKPIKSVAPIIVAFIGLAKSGKSSATNSLIGKRIRPTAQKNTTHKPAFIGSSCPFMNEVEAGDLDYYAHALVADDGVAFSIIDIAGIDTSADDIDGAIAQSLYWAVRADVVLWMIDVEGVSVSGFECEVYKRVKKELDANMFATGRFHQIGIMLNKYDGEFVENDDLAEAVKTVNARTQAPIDTMDLDELFDYQEDEKTNAIDEAVRGVIGAFAFDKIDFFNAHGRILYHGDASDALKRAVVATGSGNVWHNNIFFELAHYVIDFEAQTLDCLIGALNRYFCVLDELTVNMTVYSGAISKDEKDDFVCARNDFGVGAILERLGECATTTKANESYLTILIVNLFDCQYHNNPALFKLKSLRARLHFIDSFRAQLALHARTGNHFPYGIIMDAGIETDEEIALMEFRLVAIEILYGVCDEYAITYMNLKNKHTNMRCHGVSCGLVKYGINYVSANFEWEQARTFFDDDDGCAIIQYIRALDNELYTNRQLICSKDFIARVAQRRFDLYGKEPDLDLRMWIAQCSLANDNYNDPDRGFGFLLGKMSK